MSFALLILFLASVTAYNKTDYNQRLEQKISRLESHSQASEQKQAAVLASILSKLQTQDEKIQELTDELQNTTRSSNTTATTSASEQKQAAVLASILSKLQTQDEKIQELTDELQNTTRCSNTTVTTSGGGHVAFEASTSQEVYSSLVHFQTVTLNEGGGYDAHRGAFTAPSTGTYQLWFSVYVSAYDYAFHSNTISLVVQGTSYIGHMSPVQVQQDPDQQIEQHVRLVQGIHVLHLSAGDTASVHLNIKGSVNFGSFFSGMLLR